MAQGERRQLDGCRSPSRDAGGVGSGLSVLAIVPAYASSRTLARTLDSLLRDNAECVDRVIVVCSPVYDVEQLRIAEQYENVSIIVSRARVTAGAARNLGARYGGLTSHLLFVDADCTLPVGGVHHLLTRVRAGDADCVGASILPSRDDAVSTVRHLLEFKDCEPGARSPTEWMTPSATMLCSRAAFESVGGFPDMWPGEDLVYCRALSLGGFRVVRSTDVVVRHDHPASALELLRHQMRLGRTSACARRRVPMPGTVFVRRPWLAPALFFARSLRGLLWLSRYRSISVPVFILHLPLYLGGLAAWTFGFSREAWRNGTSAERRALSDGHDEHDGYAGYNGYDGYAARARAASPGEDSARARRSAA